MDFLSDMSFSGFSLVPYRLFSYYYRISYPFLCYGFCSLRTNDNAFRLVDLYALFFFNRQLTFRRRFFSWWPTIVYCVFCVLLRGYFLVQPLHICAAQTIWISLFLAHIQLFFSEFCYFQPIFTIFLWNVQLKQIQKLSPTTVNVRI